jgi:hypothetical protein
MRLLCLVLLCGCGGAEGSNLLGDGGSTSTSDATSSADVAVAHDTGTGDDAQTGMDSGEMKDADIKDTGPKGTPLYCGQSTCTVPDQECCRTGMLNAYSYTCQMPSAPCTNGLEIPCDKAANCASLGFPNMVCCGHYVPFGQNGSLVDKVSCQQASSCTQQQQSIILCDPKDLNACPIGMCVQSMVTIQNYYFCRQN